MSPRMVSEHQNAFGETVTSYQIGRRIASIVVLDHRRASVSLFALDLKGKRVPIITDPEGNLAETFYDKSDLDAFFDRLEALPAPPPYPVPLVGTAADFTELLGVPVIES